MSLSTRPAESSRATRRTATPAPSPPAAGLLAWLVPGAGHWYLGYRDRAVIFFVTITATFWTGVAVGGVRTTMNVRENGAWFAAQVCAGPQALGAWMWARRIPEKLEFEAIYPTADIAVVYSGVAGLLNLLVIIDALARSEPTRAAAGAGRPPPRGGGT